MVFILNLSHLRGLGIPSTKPHGDDCWLHTCGATYVDQLMVVTLPQVVQDGGVVEVCQVGHILSLLILRWVHLLQKVLLEGLLLLAQG